MFKKLLFCLGAVLLGNVTVNAQRTCATMSHLEKLEQQYPGTKAQLAKAEKAIQQWKPSQQNNLRSSAAIITIPVVVHVVYKTNSQNISLAQIQSQIAALNEDFNKLNPDTINIPAAFKPALGNMQIRFELAKRDPNGDPTTGVTRTLTSENSFFDDDAVKFASRGGHDIWNRDKYLNIWVCNLGGGLLGYAQFPGSGPVSSDGVVIGYDCFGRTGTAAAPFNKGRTATHEVGHWFSLRHIWGDEPNCAFDDLVSDTPQQKDQNYGCPTFPLTNGAGAACPSSNANGAMFMNYMDYTDDACMNMFTLGQRTRVEGSLNASRPSLFTSDGLTPVIVQPLDAAIFNIQAPKSGNTCYNSITPKFILKNRGNTTLTSVTITYKLDNGTPQTYQWTGSLASFVTANVNLPGLTNLAAGPHTYTISTSSPNGQTDNDTSNDSQTASFTVVQQTAGQSLPLAESFETGAFPPFGWTRTNPDGDITWARTNAASKDGVRSAYMNNYDYNYIGEVDELIAPTLNLTSQSAPQLSFQVAYSPSGFSIPSDTLEVLASTDCGETFTSIYKKTGQALTTTASPTGNVFTPTASQWRLETVSLNNFANSSSVILKFKSTTNYENNLYLDDIKVTGVLGLKAEKFDSKLALFPNPSTGLVTLQHKNYKQATIAITNLVGQEILKQEINGASETVLNLTEKPAGVYLVKVTAEGKSYVQKLILTK